VCLVKQAGPDGEVEIAIAIKVAQRGQRSAEAEAWLLIGRRDVEQRRLVDA
jgi:hypothetical protein